MTITQHDNKVMSRSIWMQIQAVCVCVCAHAHMLTLAFPCVKTDIHAVYLPQRGDTHTPCENSIMQNTHTDSQTHTKMAQAFRAVDPYGSVGRRQLLKGFWSLVFEPLFASLLCNICHTHIHTPSIRLRQTQTQTHTHKNRDNYVINEWNNQYCRGYFEESVTHTLSHTHTHLVISKNHVDGAWLPLVITTAEGMSHLLLWRQRGHFIMQVLLTGNE